MRETPLLRGGAPRGSSKRVGSLWFFYSWQMPGRTKVAGMDTVTITPETYRLIAGIVGVGVALLSVAGLLPVLPWRRAKIVIIIVVAAASVLLPTMIGFKLVLLLLAVTGLALTFIPALDSLMARSRQVSGVGPDDYWEGSAHQEV